MLALKLILPRRVDRWSTSSVLDLEQKFAFHRALYCCWIIASFVGRGIHPDSEFVRAALETILEISEARGPPGNFKLQYKEVKYFLADALLKYWEESEWRKLLHPSQN